METKKFFKWCMVDKEPRLVPTIMQSKVWAVLADYYSPDHTHYYIGHIPTGRPLPNCFTSEVAITLCKKLRDIDDEFCIDYKFGRNPADPSDEMLEAINQAIQETEEILAILIFEIDESKKEVAKC